MSQIKIHYPCGTDDGEVEELLAMIYNSERNLKKAINFVQQLKPTLQPAAFKALYHQVQTKEHTNKPEMLLLQKSIKQLQMFASKLNGTTRKQVDVDCQKIIIRIVKEVQQNDFSLCDYIVQSIDIELLNDNMHKIINLLFAGTLENTLLIIQFSQNMLHLSNRYFLIDALVKELEQIQLLTSVQAMHLWAYAKLTMSPSNWLSRYPRAQEPSSDAVIKLSKNNHNFPKLFLKFVEDCSDRSELILVLKYKNWELSKIVIRFIDCYCYANLNGTQHLITEVCGITNYLALGLILMELHKKLPKCQQLNSFDEFRLFHQVQRTMSLSKFNTIRPDEKKPYELLQDRAPTFIRQLLWDYGVTCEVRLVNRMKMFSLFCSTDTQKVGCWTSREFRDDQLWCITIEDETSLLTIRPKNGEGELGIHEDGIVGLVQHGMKWKMEVVDDPYVNLITDKGIFT